jgi:hypothetical protein
MAENKSSIKKVYWKDVRNDVARVQPELATIIDNLDPGNDYPLYLAKYCYGDKIIDNGKFFMPTESGLLVPKDGSNVNRELQADLSYSKTHVPLGILLKNSCETQLVSSQRTIPHVLFHEGSFLALWKWLTDFNNFHPAHIFNVTSGADTTFLLPDIKNSDSFRKLRQAFGYSIKTPKNLLDHSEIFRVINKHSKTDDPWHTSILFFTDNWINKINSTDKKWIYLRCFLYKFAHDKSDYWRNNIFLNHAFSGLKENKKLKLNPYLENIVKHIIMLSTGNVAGFGTVINDSAGPFSLIQKSILEIYQLKNYVPTIMQPMHLEINDPSSCIYYSLNLPTSIEYSIKNRESVTNLEILKELKLLVYAFREEVMAGKLRFNNTLLYNILEQVDFDFFHTKEDPLGEIMLTEEMPKKDSTLLKCMVKCNSRQFAHTSAFVRGCIRISSTK